MASTRSLSVAGLAHERREVGDRRLGVAHQRAQLAQERRQVLGRGLGVGDQRVEVVERRAQVHERRVAAPQRRRQQRQRLAERAVLGSDRAGRGVRVADQVGEVVAALGDRAHRPRAGDDEARQRVLVLRRLVDQAARAGEQRVEVLGRLGGLRALAVELGLEALDHALQVAPGLRVERVEQLVEVDRRRRLRDRDRRVVRQRPARVRAGRDRDIAVRDARQRRQADDRLRALAQRRVGLLDADPHRRLVVGGQLDRAHAADRAPADLHVVALHQLTARSRRSACTRARSRASRRCRSPARRRARRRSGRRCGRASNDHSMPSGPLEAPDRNWLTNWLSESKSSSAGPDSTIRPFQRTAMYSATRLALMMSWVMTT